MKKIIAFLLVICLAASLFACGKTENEDVTVRVIALKGPTGMGMVQLMANDKAGTSANDYEFTLAGRGTERDCKCGYRGTSGQPCGGAFQ